MSIEVSDTPEATSPAADRRTPGSRGRLAILINTLTYGGAETQVSVLAQGLARRGWQIELFAMHEPTAYVEDLEACGVTVRSLGMPQRVPGPLASAALVRGLRRFRPELLHSHMYRANIFARLARPLARVPVLICTAHSIAEGGALGDERGTAERAYRLTDRLCDLTTNVSRAAVARYVRVGAAPKERITYVPNGVDTERFRPDEGARSRVRAELELRDATALLAVGRLTAAKDYPVMLEALSRLRESHPEAVLLLAGDGELEDDLRQRVAALGLEERVRFLGVRRDVGALLNAADVYVMSSRWEGLPIVLLEAAATALPMVVTNVGGNAEIVEDGVSGLVVPSRRPEALAEGLERMLALAPGERRRLGEAARAKIEREYGIEAVLDRWEVLYAELLARKRRGRAA